VPEPGLIVTMSDVAKVAGVSATTVSHVLNKSRRIDPETERAVQAAIESTGYVNDRVARSLRTGKTKTIGLAISAISNPYFGDVVHAIEKRVTANGHSILLADTHDDPAYELRAVTHLLAHRPDGILIAPSPEPHEALSKIAGRRIPTVLIDRVSPDIGNWSFDAVGVENAGPTADLVELLLDLGHRRIGMIPGRPGLQTTIERLNGFREGHLRRGLQPDDAYITTGEAHPGDAVDLLLSMALPPTALVMGNNQATIEVVRRLTERGVAIPGAMSIASFDDFPWGDLFHPRLTAIRQPVDELGERAVAMLFERMANPGLPSRTVRLPPTLVERESAAPPRKESRT
jgi:LacI family transcriptional regulator